jgi:hypothetical protein
MSKHSTPANTPHTYSQVLQCTEMIVIFVINGCVVCHYLWGLEMDYSVGWDSSCYLPISIH